MDSEAVDAKLRCYLKRCRLLEVAQPTSWKVGHSKLSGHGLIATRDIECDELVYVDTAVVFGPRCYSKYLPMCVCCYKTGSALFSCDRGCGLPVCSNECQDNEKHVEGECAYLRVLQPTCDSGWSLELLQAVVPIRALLLPPKNKELFYCVKAHEAAQHGREVGMLKKNVKGTIKPEDEEYMRRVCRAMDTNSFETAVVRGDSSTSLRAFFPVGALTNHQCVPNTRHLVNEKGELYVYATVPITKGDEVTMTYADLLWDTTMRRQFLWATKHFSCQCFRCSDATECGSLLGALYCAIDKCLGNLLPNAPLRFNSSWTCDKCGLVIKSKQIASIRAGITALIEEILYENPKKILRFIRKELSILVPETNYVLMEMMFRIVSLFGRVDGFTWPELSDEELNIKIKYCRKLVESLDKLNCGYCTKKGLILYELHCTNLEKLKRISAKDETLCTPLMNEVDNSTNEQILLEAIKILKNDIVAPSDYRKIYSERSLISYKV